MSRKAFVVSSTLSARRRRIRIVRLKFKTQLSGPIRKKLHFSSTVKQEPTKRIDLGEAVTRSLQIRKAYHQLEMKHHGSEWTTEEDALAFLTDAGLVGRLTMSQQGRWPMDQEVGPELEHKLGECIWWLIVLADRMNIDVEKSLEVFLTKTEKQLNG